MFCDFFKQDKYNQIQNKKKQKHKDKYIKPRKILKKLLYLFYNNQNNK